MLSFGASTNTAGNTQWSTGAIGGTLRTVVVGSDTGASQEAVQQAGGVQNASRFNAQELVIDTAYKLTTESVGTERRIVLQKRSNNGEYTTIFSLT